MSCQACGHDCTAKFTCHECDLTLNVCYNLVGGFPAYLRGDLLCDRCRDNIVSGKLIPARTLRDRRLRAAV